MRQKFSFIGSLVLSLYTAGCTSTQPVEMTLDMSMDLASSADMAMAPDLSDPPDLTTLPPDLTPACGFGQAFSNGSCACDANHAQACGGAPAPGYCCAATQQCLIAAGPRGETRCSGAPKRRYFAMAYHPGLDRTLLRGGICVNGSGADVLCADQWEHGPQTWNEQNVPNSPGARYGASAIYDGNANNILVFGGIFNFLNNQAAVSNDMYTWDGTTWSKKTPALLPSARTLHAMAYDPARKVDVLFGGTDAASISQSDTWEWNGTTWLKRSLATNPVEREGHSMVYDLKNSRTLMFGGFKFPNYLREVWVYAGSDWQRLTGSENAAMPVRAYQAMAYDANRNVTVLFGGETTGSVALSDTWEFDGTTWTKKAPAVIPTERAGAAMVYDAGRKQVLLFGGLKPGVGMFNDLWAWDGTNWKLLY